MLCQELYFRYCMDFSESTFERFYRSTIPVFFSFAVERCNEAENPIDPQEVVNRLYGILVSHAMDRQRIPIRVLFSWCFGVISNLVREEQRFSKRQHCCLEELEYRPGGTDPLDQMISTEETNRKQSAYKGILHLIERPNSLLPDRERRVMALFYCQGLTLKKIAQKLDITPEHAGVILFRARKRLANHFRRTVWNNPHITDSSTAAP